MSIQGEIERLEAHHRVFNLIFDGRLIFPPITNLRNVLDCGYGAASWAVEVAETYPDCEVGAHPHTDTGTHFFIPSMVTDPVSRSSESIYPHTCCRTIHHRTSGPRYVFDLYKS